MLKIIIAIFIFSFLIFFHELGHCLAAKACGIRVNQFFIGFGPALLKFQGKETEYSLRILPFGGACVMEGEDEESADVRAFSNKSVWKRLIVVFAGPLFNFILAFIMAIVLLSFAGVDRPIITGVMEGYPAEEAGLEAGDEIISINHSRIFFFKEISLSLFMKEDQPADVVYKRDGQTYETVMTPKYSAEDDRYYLGITSTLGREKTSAAETLKYALCEIRYQIRATFMSLRMLVTGKVGVTDLSGPVGIVSTIGETYEAAAKEGAFTVFLNMINIAILLSANLGVMNLLPIPALDGGRILLLLVEAVRRKKLSEKLEGTIHMIGFAALMALMVIVMISDIYKLF